jgi:uncharacterized protein (DUF2267 family)
MGGARLDLAQIRAPASAENTVREMIMSALQNLRAAVSETEAWINDVTQRLGWRDRERVYLVLLATLHALRDSLPQDEAIYIGAQLPPLLRGFYYEGWHPGASRGKEPKRIS